MNYLIISIVGMFCFMLGRLGRQKIVIDTESLKNIANSLSSICKVINKWEQVRRNDRIAELNKLDELNK